MEFTYLGYIAFVTILIFSYIEVRKAKDIQTAAQIHFAEITRQWVMFFEIQLGRSLQETDVYVNLQCVLSEEPKELVEESWFYLSDAITIDRLPISLLTFLHASGYITDVEFTKLSKLFPTIKFAELS